MSLRPRDEDENDEEGRNVRGRIEDEVVNDKEGACNDDDDDDDDEGKPIREDEVTWQNQGGTYTFHLKLNTNYDYDQAKRVDTDLYFRKDNDSSNANKRGEEVGYLTGHLLPRPSSIFYAMADSISDELKGLACMFCNSTGHANRVETGLSGHDVYNGGLFQICVVEVGRGHQGKCDLGLRLIHETMVFLKNDWNLAVMVPSLLNAHRQRWPEDNDRQNVRRVKRFGTDSELSADQQEGLKVANINIKKHFARMGFLQAGRNSEQHHAWYMVSNAYFGETEHSKGSAMDRWKSKHEAQTMDVFDPPEKHIPTGLDLELNKAVGLAGTCPIAESIQSIEDLVGRGASIDNARALHAAAALQGEDTAILRTLVRLGGNVNHPDENGYCPLHVAALLNHPAAIECLLGSGADKNLQNDKGDTPLESLQSSLTNKADFQNTIGFSSGPQDMNPFLDSTWALLPEATRSLLVDGWLPPRMLETLTITAEICSEDVHACTDVQFLPNLPTPLSKCAGGTGIYHIDYIPREVLEQNPEGLYQSFSDGWGMIFNAIGEVLRRKQAPSLTRIRNEMERCSDVSKYNHFLQKGGKIDFALDAVLSLTKDVWEDGDGCWGYETFEEQIEALPATPLDGAFDIARVKCFEIKPGDSRPGNMGPYYHDFDED